MVRTSFLSYPGKVLLCPPDSFDVIDVKNAFMADNVGLVDRNLAREQWLAVREVFERIGLAVHEIRPIAGLEDMVFCANQSFVGIDRFGRFNCVLSHMQFPSRQKEVAAFGNWFARAGYEITQHPDPEVHYEGGGDILWHPTRRLILGGVGPRTEKLIYPWLSELFDAEVVELNLSFQPFYHLDTALCAVDEKSVLIAPMAFDEKGLKKIRQIFPDVIEVNEEEAMNMACNAAAFFGTDVIIQQGSPTTADALRTRGKRVHEVDTSEFMKSGGSVFCMKMAFY